MRHPILAVILAALLAAACEEEATPAASTESPFVQVDQALRAGRYEEARGQLQDLRASLGDTPELIARLAGMADREGDLAGAVVLYKDGLRAHPDSAGLWSSLGDLYWRLRQFDRAIEALERARSLGQDDAFVALSLGVARAQKGELERAEEELGRARELGAPPATVDYNLALLRQAQMRYREAVELLRRAVATTPEDSNAWRELGNALLLGDASTPETLAEVQKIAWKVIDARPTEWRGHMLLGDVFHAQGDWVAAVEAYTEALRHGQNPPEVERKYVAAMTALKAAEAASGGGG